MAWVKGPFETRQEADAYLENNAEEIITHRFEFPEKPHLDWIDRTPPAQPSPYERAANENVTPRRFQEVFGFRAGEFGNWNMGSDGQAALNHAYDALLDLAGVLNIPPKAISLNGDLAIAFGARGTGGKNSALAHYEAGARVINLTKIRGAGALAHEWFHALDHYFYSLAKGHRATGFVTREGQPYQSQMRDEMQAAFKALQQVMTSRMATTAITAQPQQADRSERYLREHLAELKQRMLSPIEAQYHKRYKAPPREQLARWDELTEQHVTDPGEGYYPGQDKPMRGMRGVQFWKSYTALDELNAIHKAVLNRAFLKKDASGYSPQAVALTNSMLQARERIAKAEAGETQTNRVSTEFYSNARFMDRFRSGDYWSTPHEMAARAFESYVTDRLKAEGRVSQYLVVGADDRNPSPEAIADESGLFMFPYPYQTERREINQAFDRMFGRCRARRRIAAPCSSRRSLAIIQACRTARNPVTFPTMERAMTSEAIEQVIEQAEAQGLGWEIKGTPANGNESARILTLEESREKQGKFSETHWPDFRWKGLPALPGQPK